MALQFSLFVLLYIATGVILIAAIVVDQLFPDLF